MYAKLIGQVVQQWLLVTCGGPSVAYSQPKAARRVRRQVPVLALAAVADVVRERLRQRLQKRCRVQKRGGRPSCYERLLDPDRVCAQDEQPEEETELQAA